MTTFSEKLAEETCQKFEPIAKDQRARTFPAKLLDQNDTIFSQGEARLENEPEPSIYCPEGGKVTPDEIVARAEYVELADDKKSKVRIKEIKFCDKGSEDHYHFYPAA